MIELTTEQLSAIITASLSIGFFGGITYSAFIDWYAKRKAG